MSTTTPVYYDELKRKMESFLSGTKEIVDPETKYDEFCAAVFKNLITVKAKVDDIVKDFTTLLKLRHSIAALTPHECEYLDIANAINLVDQKDNIKNLYQAIPDINITSINPETRRITFEAPFTLKYHTVEFVHKTRIAITFGSSIDIRVTKHPMHKSGNTRMYFITPNSINSETFVSSVLGAIYNRLSNIEENLILDPIEGYIGKKCTICHFHTFTEPVVTCPETKMVMHKDCAVNVSGNYYSPHVAKPCCKCKKVSLKWVPNADNVKLVTCGSCLDE